MEKALEIGGEGGKQVYGHIPAVTERQNFLMFCYLMTVPILAVRHCGAGQRY